MSTILQIPRDTAWPQSEDRHEYAARNGVPVWEMCELEAFGEFVRGLEVDSWHSLLQGQYLRSLAPPARNGADNEVRGQMK